MNIEGKDHRAKLGRGFGDAVLTFGPVDWSPPHDRGGRRITWEALAVNFADGENVLIEIGFL